MKKKFQNQDGVKQESWFAAEISTHHKTFSMHLCFRSASCGILSDLGFQGPPRNFERISDSKKATDIFFWCFFKFFSLVSTCFLPFFQFFTFDLSVICSKWNLTKVVLRPRTVSGTLELRGAEYRRLETFGALVPRYLVRHGESQWNKDRMRGYARYTWKPKYRTIQKTQQEKGKDSAMINDKNKNLAELHENKCRLRRLWHHTILYFPRSLAFERPRANWTSTEWCAPRTIPCLPKVASRRQWRQWIFTDLRWVFEENRWRQRLWAAWCKQSSTKSGTPGEPRCILEKR